MWGAAPHIQHTCGKHSPHPYYMWEALPTYTLYVGSTPHMYTYMWEALPTSIPMCGKHSPHAYCMWEALPTCKYMWGGAPHMRSFGPDRGCLCLLCLYAILLGFSVFRLVAYGVFGCICVCIYMLATAFGVCGVVCVHHCMHACDVSRR
jgi:hypothetical protein